MNTITDQCLNCCAYVMTWALVENVGWFMAPILFVIIQIISWRLGSGFFMVAVRQMQHMMKDKDKQQNDNPTDATTETTETKEKTAKDVEAGDQPHDS